MYVEKHQLNGWLDTVGTVIGAVATERQSTNAAKISATESAARIAAANANVEAAKLALQAEALRSKQPPKGIGAITSNTPLMIGAAAMLGAGVFFMVRRRKGR
jgi:LPXTG-motif cell wall-anchored protein